MTSGSRCGKRKPRREDELPGIAPRVEKIVLSYEALALFLDFPLNPLTVKCYVVGLTAFLIGDFPMAPPLPPNQKGMKWKSS